MSPGLNRLLDPSRLGQVGGRVSFGSDSEEEGEDMALLDDTYQQSRIQAGEEVESFATWLDECNLTRGTPSQKRERILKLVNRYYGYTQEKADTLRDRRRLKGSSRRRTWEAPQSSDDANDMDLDGHDTKEVGELDKWESEAQTWDLLNRLLPLRYPDPSAKPPTKSTTVPRSRKQYWDEFVLSDSTARERKAVLDWLQSSACDGPDIDDLVHDFQEKANRGDIIAHGWLHTRSAIKLHKSVNAWPHLLDPKAANASDFTYVTQLDPDAMTRQNRKLEPSDEYFERAIWLGCFHLLRRGKTMAEIRDWCLERTEIWRAATISALPLSAAGDDDSPDFDPESAVLWRRMCYALVKQGGTDDLERAVYGVLSGDISSVLKVCKNWDDYLFANYNALLRTQFDSHLIKQSANGASPSQLFPAFDAVQFLGDSNTLAKRLISKLETDGNYSIQAKEEANSVSKALQGSIIADTLDSYINEQGLILSSEANQAGKSFLIPDSGFGVPAEKGSKYIKMSDHDGLRVITHILILILGLDTIGSNEKARGGLQSRHLVGEHAIAAYVSFLRLACLEELIPLYCSKLSGSRRYEILSLNVIHLTDREARLTQLRLMKKQGLDIDTFLKEHPQQFLKQLPDAEGACPAKGKFHILKHSQSNVKFGRSIVSDFFGGDGRMELSHEHLIRSIEWFQLSDGLLFEACEYGTKIYKYFLKHMHLQSARKFFEQDSVLDLVKHTTGKDIPEDSDANWINVALGGDSGVLGEEIDDGTEEYGVSRVRMATAAKNMWELESLVKALDALETIANLEQLFRDNNGLSMPKEYTEELGRQVRQAKAHMAPVLRSWMLETDEEDTDIPDLREAYLPETILAYVGALQFAGTSLSRDFLLECMDLAAVIAEKDSDIAALFVKTGRMKELVEAFASASKALAIWTVDNKKASSHSSAKKMREMGWTRELWNVKTSGPPPDLRNSYET